MANDDRCEMCGDRGTDDDPVLDYTIDEPGDWRKAHIECAQGEGWEE